MVKSDVYPSLSLLGGVGSKNHAQLSSGAGGEKISEGFRGFYLSGVGLTWNLSSLYNSAARKSRAANRVEEVQSNYREAELRLEAAYHNAAENEKRYREKRSQSQKALRLANDAFESYRNRYEHGLIDMISLLQLQKNVQDAEENHVKAVADYWQEMIRIACATSDAEFLIF